MKNFWMIVFLFAVAGFCFGVSVTNFMKYNFTWGIIEMIFGFINLGLGIFKINNKGD